MRAPRAVWWGSARQRARACEGVAAFEGPAPRDAARVRSRRVGARGSRRGAVARAPTWMATAIMTTMSVHTSQARGSSRFAERAPVVLVMEVSNPLLRADPHAKQLADLVCWLLLLVACGHALVAPQTCWRGSTTREVRGGEPRAPSRPRAAPAARARLGSRADDDDGAPSRALARPPGCSTGRPRCRSPRWSARTRRRSGRARSSSISSTLAPTRAARPTRRGARSTSTSASDRPSTARSRRSCSSCPSRSARSRRGASPTSSTAARSSSARGGRGRGRDRRARARALDGRVVRGARAAHGLAAAFLTPAAFALVGELYAGGGARRAQANSALSAGVYVGGALASLTSLVGDAAGWRGAYVATAGACALAAAGALAAFGLGVDGWRGERGGRRARADGARARRRGARAAEKEPPLALSQSLALIFGSRTVVLLYVASALRFVAGFTILAWLAPYVRDAFSPADAAPFAVVNAAIKSGGGLTATALGAAAVGALRAAGDRAPPREGRARARRARRARATRRCPRSARSSRRPRGRRRCSSTASSSRWRACSSSTCSPRTGSARRSPCSRRRCRPPRSAPRRASSRG